MKLINNIQYRLAIVFFPILIILFSLVSCEDYLEEENPNSVSSDIYWSNLEESNANLTSVYGAMLNQFIYSFDIDGWRSDMAYPRDRRNPLASGLAWHQQIYTENNRELINRWGAIYQLIFRANQVIEGLNGMDSNFKADQRWVEQMGQARFFRGLGHFYLHSAYNHGEIIIRDKVPASSEEFSKKLSTSEEVIKFFREDLEYAYLNLPESFENKSRVTAGTAGTILGKSYLYTEEYEQAKLYFNDIINNERKNYGYKLLEGDDVKLLFTNSGDYNSESIFEINYSDKQQVEDDQWDEEGLNNRWARFSAPGGNVIGGSASFVPSAWLTYEYSSEQMDTQDSRNYVDNGSGGLVLRKVSLRASQMIAVVNDEEATYYNRKPGNKIVDFANTTFSFFKKYTNHDIVNSENEQLGTSWKSGKNIVINRLSDVYLMLAECQIKTGQVADAIININKIRQRWGLTLLGLPDGSAHDFDGITYTEESLMERLMNVERPLELSVEGFATRNIDLRRWGTTKKRLEDLAELDFNLMDYPYVSEDGKNGNRARSLLKKGISADPSDNRITIKEYVIPASNYNNSLHDYLPIPTTEVTNNQLISN